MKIIRSSTVSPGHDCIYDKCKMEIPCQTEPPRSMRNLSSRSHGISSDKWCYNVVLEDKSFAVSLVVSSRVYPSTVPKSHFRPSLYSDDVISGSNLVLHWIPRNAKEVCLPDCGLLEGPCAADSSGLWADAFFKEFGQPQFEQSEDFWLALENILKERSGIKPCPTTGPVESSSSPSL
jgi:hypothetical protein